MKNSEFKKQDPEVIKTGDRKNEKKQNLFILGLKGIFFIYLPLMLLVFSIYYFTFEKKFSLSWDVLVLRPILFFALLAALIIIMSYRVKTKEVDVTDFAKMENYIRKGRWKIVDKNDDGLIVKPTFDFPLRMIIDDTVTIKYSEEKVFIEGALVYVNNIVKEIKGKSSIWTRKITRLVVFILIVIVVSLPILAYLGLPLEISKIRHNGYIENVEVLQFNPADVLGNSIVNTNNNGYAVENDKYIFYVEDSTNLIRVDKEFKNKKILLERTDGNGIMRLNIAGDCIYYASCEQLNRISIDGDKDETIYKLGYLLDLHMKDNWIYFINFSDKSNVYKMDLNGRNLERLLEIRADDMAIYADRMIFSHSEGEKSFIESINLDGSDRRLEFEDKASNLIELGDYYYYIGEDFGLYRRLIGGNIGREVLFDGKVEAYTIAENKIFYSLRSEDGGHLERGLYQIELDGTSNTLITDMEIMNWLSVVGDWLLFSSINNENQLRFNRLKLLTGEIELME